MSRVLFTKTNANWHSTILGDICLEKKGLQTGPFGSQLHAAEYKSEGIPVVMPKDLIAQRISTEDIARISTKRANDLIKHQLKAGDIVFGRRGDIGRCALVSSNEQGWICGTGCLRARLKEHVDPEFITYFLGLPHTIYWLESNAVGQTMLNLNTEILAALPITLPPLPEQRRIAEILSTWDEAISLTQRLIKAKQRRKQGLMQRLLTGSVRLPGFDGGWLKTSLEKIAELIAGATPSRRVKKYWKNGHIPWMKSGEVHLKRIYDVEGRITQQGLENSSTKMIPKNCVLIALAGQGITRGMVAINKIELCTNQSIAAIIPKTDVLYYEYLFYNFDKRYEEFRRLSSGDGGRGGLNLGLLKGVEILLPPLPEQRAIAAVLQTADEEIGLLERKLAALRQQKQGLMQRLLTGEVRV